MIGKKIILVGYMGTGKSIIADLLSKMYHVPLLDLDKMIEEKEKMSIPTLFEKKGELYFRKIEHLIFKEIITHKTSFVLSTGGGTPCYSNNHIFMKELDVISIYLKTSIDELYNRLSENKEQRPLLRLKTADELKEFIAKHLFERSYYYNQAKHIVNTDGKTPDMVVAEIAKIYSL